MFNESEHPRDKDGKFTDGKKQGLTKGENSVRISGGTSGGTSGATVDPNSKMGEEKAIALYDEIRCSDADIADSWLRLAAGTKHVLPHDITLIRHEIEEMRCIDSGMTQAEAHELASQKYDYDKECREYHGKAGKRKERR